jgi:hypothetical protein
VYRFHQNTLHALQELVQAAGLKHPNEITASHIVRRTADSDVRLLANQLPLVAPGALLDRWPAPTASRPRRRGPEPPGAPAASLRDTVPHPVASAWAARHERPIISAIDPC